MTVEISEIKPGAKFEKAETKEIILIDSVKGGMVSASSIDDKGNIISKNQSPIQVYLTALNALNFYKIN